MAKDEGPGAREHRRFPAHIPAQFEIVHVWQGGSAAPLTGELYNVSRGGAGVPDVAHISSFYAIFGTTNGSLYSRVSSLLASTSPTNVSALGSNFSVWPIRNAQFARWQWADAI